MDRLILLETENGIVLRYQNENDDLDNMLNLIFEFSNFEKALDWKTTNGYKSNLLTINEIMSIKKPI